jgi:septum formation protein
MQLVLASASPRRLQLLEQIGVGCVIDPADIDETAREYEAPVDYVQRMAQEKAHAVFVRPEHAQHAVLAADTSVVLDGDILGKPADRGAALAMLARLSGREHEVMTAVCLLHAGNAVSEVVTTRVEFVTLTLQMCEAYLATDEPWDKAGAYAIQGLAAAFVRSIVGSYSNVVGLPLAETWRMLDAAGIANGLQIAGPAPTE